MQPETLDTHGTSGNFFASSHIMSPKYSTHGMTQLWGELPYGLTRVNRSLDMLMETKNAIPTSRFLRFSSNRNSFDPMDDRYFKNYEVDPQRLQIPQLHFDKFPAPQTFSCRKIRFKAEVCSFFQTSPTEAMLWIKEVQTANSVDDLKSSSSIQRITPFLDSVLLDARIASARNNNIQNSYFTKKISLEDQKAQKTAIPHERQIAHLIYDCFRVTGVNDSVLDCAALFSVFRNDNIQEFDTRWDEILLSMVWSARNLPF